MDPGETQRFNPAHAPAGSADGGQFAAGAGGGAAPAKGGKSAKSTTKPARPAAHGASTPKAPTHLTKTLAYNAATDHGPGYGTRHGDAHVHQLQRALNRLGLTDANGHQLADDGKLGPLTTQAVKAAQKRLGLNPDGKVTPALYTRLLATKNLPAPLPRRGLDTRESPAPHPGSAEKLHEYWVHGEGAAKIRWGEPGDFDRCTHQLEEHAHFTPEQAHGYCNLAHHAALGIYPATHAKLLGKHATSHDGGRSVSDGEEHIMSAVERRFTTVTVELRADGDQPRIGGYAAMFNKVSQNLGGFVEVVERSFFNKARGDGWPNVLCRYNHDDNQLLGTTAARTLELRLDETGLDYNVVPPRTGHGPVVVEMVQRGDIRKSSFAFQVPSGGEDWGLSEQGYPMRHLITGALVDVAPVNSPAYTDTSAGMRSLAPAEIHRLGLGPEAAYRSLAARMDADVDEVRAAAGDNDLVRFFRRSDGPTPPKRKPTVFGPAAALALLQRKADPWMDE